MPAQMTRCLGRDPRAPRQQHRGSDVVEQLLGQPDGGDRLEFDHLGRDGLDTDVARLVPDRGEHLRAHTRPVLGWLRNGQVRFPSALNLARYPFVLLSAGPPVDQGKHPGHCAGGNPRTDPPRQALLGPLQRRANHPRQSGGGWWLDPLFTQVGQQRRADPFRAPLTGTPARSASRSLCPRQRRRTRESRVNRRI
jgi:hypothetical protein